MATTTAANPAAEAATTTGGWQLTDPQRSHTVDRLAANLASLAFFRDRAIGDAQALSAARDIERRAYTAAQVSARTTTGHRPAAETTSAYARKMGELVVEAVKAGVPAAHPQHAPAPSSAEGGGGDWWHDLSSAGARDFLDEEGARRALAPLLEPKSTVGRVRLSTKSFGAAAAAVAAAALRNVAQHLSHADLSDIIAGRPEDEALEALRVITAGLAEARLTHLDLSDNALGEKGVRACAGALTGEAGGALEFLALGNVGCSVHACAAVEELVVGGKLKGLHLYNNMSGDEGAEHIARVLARAAHMEDFRMTSSRVGPKGGAALARALTTGAGAAAGGASAEGGALVRLDLSDNPLTAGCAAELAACVARHPRLACLNLNDTSLGDEGVAAVCAALEAKDAASAARLEELGLALNELTAEGAKCVARALGSGKFVGLRRLNLRENELEDAGALALKGMMAALPALEHLDLCCNQIGRVGAVGVARALAAAAEQQKGDKAPALRCLALDENAISEAGVDQLKAVVKKAYGDEGVLGPLDENDADGADDDDEEEDEEEKEGGDDGGLSAAMAGVNL